MFFFWKVKRERAEIFFLTFFFLWLIMNENELFLCMCVVWKYFTDNYGIVSIAWPYFPPYFAHHFKTTMGLVTMVQTWPANLTFFRRKFHHQPTTYLLLQLWLSLERKEWPNCTLPISSARAGFFFSIFENIYATIGCYCRVTRIWALFLSTAEVS